MYHHIICVFNEVQIKLNNSILIHSGEVKLFTSSVQFFLYTCLFFAGLVGRYSEPQPKAGPNLPGHRTGLFPGDGPAESPRHPLQERVRGNLSGEKSILLDSCVKSRNS